MHAPLLSLAAHVLQFVHDELHDMTCILEANKLSTDAVEFTFVICATVLSSTFQRSHTTPQLNVSFSSVFVGYLQSIGKIRCHSTGRVAYTINWGGFVLKILELVCTKGFFNNTAGFQFS